MAINLSAAIFILPFFLLSGWAGEFADRYEKSQIIRNLKLMEVIISLIAVAGLYFQNIYFLWTSLFLYGVQAAFFGPLKYSILPQHLKEHQLLNGNSLIEAGTFLAILIGTIMGGILITSTYGWAWVGGISIAVAFMGYFSSRSIPLALPEIIEGKLGFNIFKKTAESIRIAKQSRTIFLSILGISWFWFFGATLLSQFPVLVKNAIGGQENIVTLFLTTFSIGIALGSLLCSKLSDKKVEIGLVPFGAIGLSIFSLDLFYAFNSFQALQNASIMTFIQAPGSYRILFDLTIMSMFGGFFIVPLYAVIQARSENSVRSRIIGANNIMNAAFMVAAALYAIGVVSLGFEIHYVILGLAILNTLVAIYIFTLVPEFLLRFVVWIATHTFYRIHKEGLENVPETGGGLIICNHVAFIDSLIIFGSIRRPVKFVMYYKIFEFPVMNYIFRSVGAIPIAPAKENPEVLKAALEKIQEYLEKGELVVVFPEGKITMDGEMGEFKPGVLRIIEKTPVPLIPSALIGFYGSVFTKQKRKVGRYLPKTFLNRKVTYRVGKPLYNGVTLEETRKSVEELL